MNAKYIINEHLSVKDALKTLDGNTHDWQTLFVVNDSCEMVGTLTDGDVRRGLINGTELTDNVAKIMHRDFKYINEGEIDVKKLREFRNRQIFFLPVLDHNRHIVNVLNLVKYKTFLPVDAVLMAGGKGERLRPLTEKTPKPLLKVGDKAIIDHNVDRLISYGIKNISVTVNYLKEQLEVHYQDPRNGVQVNCVREPRFLGTLGSIKFVENFHHDTVLVMNSDIFTNLDYEDFYLHFMEHEADMSVAAVPYDVSVPYGILDLEGRVIKGVLEKPTYNYFVNAGIYLIKRELLDLIPNDEVFNATDLIGLLVEKNKKVVRFPLNGTWIDIGNPQEYQKAKDLIHHMK